MSEPQDKRGVLNIITCAARSSEPMYVEDLVVQALSDGWEVGVIATPHARNFINTPRLERITGYPVRSEYRHPDTTDNSPEPDAIIAFPVTFNTMNKWASGVADTLALSILCAHLGMGTPIIAIPCVPEISLARHPAFPRSIAMLQEYGVHVIYEPDTYPPMNNVPWDVMLQRVSSALALRGNALSQKDEYISR